MFSEFNQPLAYEAQEQGIHVFGIGVGLSRADNEELENLVSDTDTVVDPFNPELGRLNDMVDRIVARLCDGMCMEEKGCPFEGYFVNNPI